MKAWTLPELQEGATRFGFRILAHFVFGGGRHAKVSSPSKKRRPEQIRRRNRTRGLFAAQMPEHPGGPSRS